MSRIYFVPEPVNVRNVYRKESVIYIVHGVTEPVQVNINGFHWGEYTWLLGNKKMLISGMEHKKIGEISNDCWQITSNVKI